MLIQLFAKGIKFVTKKKKKKSQREFDFHSWGKMGRNSQIE